jgi:20S proteasome alpha/beta subunit
MRFSLLLVSIILSYAHQASASAAGQETLIGIVGADFVLLGADSSVSQNIAVASRVDKIAVVRPNIAAAAAGDADRLVGLLKANAIIQEYEAGIGEDVIIVDCSGKASSLGGDASSFAPVAITQHNSPHVTAQAVATFARNQIYSQLRTRDPHQVCLLIAGMERASTSTEHDTLVATTSASFSSQQVQHQVQTASLPYISSKIASKESDTPRPHESLLQPRLYWLDEYGSLQTLAYGAHGYGSNFVWSILDQGYKQNMSRQEAVALMQKCFAQLGERYVINSPHPPLIKCLDNSGCHVVR